MQADGGLFADGETLDTVVCHVWNFGLQDNSDKGMKLLGGIKINWARNFFTEILFRIFKWDLSSPANYEFIKTLSKTVS